MNKRYSVFVSSTYIDLQDERKKVMEALLQMNCFPVGMEYLNASEESQWEVIKKLIDECDYFVLIIAGRYGSIEESSGISYTQKEYEYAVSIGVPTISFIYYNISSLPRGKTEAESAIAQKLDAFKEKVKKHFCRFWDNSDHLASQVVLSLSNLIKKKPRPGWVRIGQIAQSEVEDFFKHSTHSVDKTEIHLDSVVEDIHATDFWKGKRGHVFSATVTLGFVFDIICALIESKDSVKVADFLLELSSYIESKHHIHMRLTIFSEDVARIERELIKSDLVLITQTREGAVLSLTDLGKQISIERRIERNTTR